MPGPLSAYLPSASDDDVIPEGTRWMVRHIKMEDGTPTRTPYILHFSDHFTVPTAYDALRERLNLIGAMAPLTTLPRHCKGTWRVFDLKSFEATDFNVFVGPPRDVENVLHVEAV